MQGRTRKQHRLLADQADLGVQELVVYRVQWRAIQQDLAGPRGIED